MGGLGSGSQRRQSAARRTDEFRHLDVRLLQREGLLVQGREFSWWLSRSGETGVEIVIRAEHELHIFAAC